VNVQLLSARDSDDLSVLPGRINVRSAVCCLSDLGAPWGFSVGASDVAKFHLVLAGSALLTVEDIAADQVKLDAGELVLLPGGSAHVMRDSVGAPAPPLDAILAGHPVAGGGRLTYGGDGTRTSLLCGGFSLTPGLPGNLLSLLPPALVIDAARHGITRWLGPIFGLLHEEVASQSPGGTAVLAKIADVLSARRVPILLPTSRCCDDPLNSSSLPWSVWKMTPGTRPPRTATAMASAP
jgi:hypothetical protein